MWGAAKLSNATQRRLSVTGSGNGVAACGRRAFEAMAKPSSILGLNAIPVLAHPAGCLRLHEHTSERRAVCHMLSHVWLSDHQAS